MSNKNTHTWADEYCTVCGIERNYILHEYGNKKWHTTEYYKGAHKLNFLPPCSGQFVAKKTSKPLKRTAIKKKPRKTTGERAINLEIWAERPHICFVTKEPLGNEPLPVYFMHVLGKKAYPAFRLKKENIVLGTAEIHNQYDSGTTINDPIFKPLLALKQFLKEEYYKTVVK